MAISLDEVEAHPFECADPIHDAVEPTDYKEIIRQSNRVEFT